MAEVSATTVGVGAEKTGSDVTGLKGGAINGLECTIIKFADIDATAADYYESGITTISKTVFIPTGVGDACFTSHDATGTVTFLDTNNDDCDGHLMIFHGV